ncbi:OmpW family outer membrane protein [Epilithonimonas sp.]|uniref:outer membrane protein n=1 Tax=Epilithonimonas sp. TaxID=2894511 RepID=UPI00289F6C5E|nr:OmpW family outer membrane protein [Epilithonimonas sp.]
MKKLFLVGALALFGAMNAQTEKGSWVISGSTTIGFNNTSSKVKYNGNSVDGPKTTSFNIKPSAGYFVANNIAVGVDLSFTSTKNESTQYFFDQELNFESKSNTVVVMPNATYYFKSASKVMPYLGAGIGYFSNTIKYPSDFSSNEEVKETIDGLAWGAKGGVVFLVTPSIGIDLGLAYVNTSNKENDVKNVTNSFGVNAGFSFFFK